MQCLVDRLLLLAARSRLLPGLILIFLRVQFEIKEILQVATAARAASTAAALLAERHLNIAASRFGAHEELQRLLLIG